jgi:hypothetical protein
LSNHKPGILNHYIIIANMNITLLLAKGKILGNKETVFCIMHLLKSIARLF